MSINAPFLSRLVLLLGLALSVFSMTGRAQDTQTIFFGLTNSWRYNQAVSYDGTNWTAPAFNDAALPVGRGVLALEDANNAFVTSRTNTALTLGRLTYYFRTTFVFTGNPAGLLLTFSNLVDDGAVFYLNGRELNRLYLPAAPTTISYATLANSHEASAFDVFTLSGPLVETNLVNGTNVLAVEVHQATASSSDIVFGCALSARFAEFTPPPLRLPLVPPVYGYAPVNAFPGLSFGAPVGMAAPPGETNRLFVINKAGTILVITNLAAPNLTTFLNITPKVFDSGESGLLGLDFHPGYATNRYFYVFYSCTASTTQGTNRLHQRLARYQTSATNDNFAPTNSEQVLITQADPASNHNGGDVHFGPDGYLYVSYGDGGAQYDTDRNSQIITSNFFSAILRLDVDSPPRAGSLLPNPHPANTNNPGLGINYRIPADNPFLGRTSFDGFLINPANIRTEFYAVGFRNPWRFSFDPLTGFLYCADVGQDTYEEVDIVTKGGNYGWAYREGLHPGYRPGTTPEPLLDPIQEYRHGNATNQGNSISGGIVYRGSRFPELHGWYVFADYVSGNIWRLRSDGTNTVPFQRLAGQGGLSAFGADPSNGDVLMANVNNGTLQRLVYDTSSATSVPIPPTLAGTGAFTNLATLTNQTQALGVSDGLLPYDINVPFWSDHAHKSRWFLTATNLKIGFQPEGNWSFGAGQTWIKHFDLELTNGVASSARRLETRFLVKNSNGVYGITYRWGNSLTNATLVPEEGLDEAFAINDGGTMRTQVWHYPSRTECLSCHTPVAGFGLGFNTVQMNRDFGYAGGESNQIAFLSAAGIFSNTVADVHALRALAHATNESASLEWRVRSHLAANCAQCHQPGGSGLGTWNANITNSTAGAGLINGPLNNYFNNTNNRVIVPGSLSNSMLLARISVRGPGQMPPLASSVLDTQAMALLSRWITNDLPGYQTFAQWQMANFGGTNAPNAGATFDADDDGASNSDEYVAGTSPLNASDVWRINARTTNDQSLLEFVQPANRAFQIQWITNLATPVLWNFLDAPENRPTYPSAPRSRSVAEPLTNAPFKFYRVRLNAP